MIKSHQGFKTTFDNMERGISKHRHTRTLREEFEDEVKEIEHLQKILYNRRKAQFRRIRQHAIRAAGVIQRSWRLHLAETNRYFERDADNPRYNRQTRRTSSTTVLTRSKGITIKESYQVSAFQHDGTPSSDNSSKPLQAEAFESLTVETTGIHPRDDPTTLRELPREGAAGVDIPTNEDDTDVESIDTQEHITSIGPSNDPHNGTQQVHVSTAHGAMVETAQSNDQRNDTINRDSLASSSSGSEDNSYADDDDFHSYEHLESARTDTTHPTKPVDIRNPSPDSEKSAEGAKPTATEILTNQNDDTRIPRPLSIPEMESNGTKGHTLPGVVTQTPDDEVSGDDVVSDLDELFLQ